MQGQRSTESARSTSDPSRAEIRSAAVHAAQSRLLLLREATENGDPDLERELRDMAGILAHVISAIDELEATRKLGVRR
jgi:hypothetical protein